MTKCEMFSRSLYSHNWDGWYHQQQMPAWLFFYERALSSSGLFLFFIKWGI